MRPSFQLLRRAVGPFGPPGPFGPFYGAFGPSSVGEGANQRYSIQCQNRTQKEQDALTDLVAWSRWGQIRYVVVVVVVVRNIIIWAQIQQSEQLQHQLYSTDSSDSDSFIPFHFWPPGKEWRHLQMILSCWALQYGRLDTLNIKIRLQTAEIIVQFHFWPPAPLANDPIMLGTSIRSFRHLKH